MSCENHKWGNGEWQRLDKGDRYFTRIDICDLCGCERRSIKFTRRGITRQMVVTYERSKQIFGHENMPECWGAKNPV